MCFHSKQTKKAKEVSNRFEAEIEDLDNFPVSDHFIGFEYPKTPIITNEDIHLVQNVSWGLHPNWAPDDWNRNYTLNARIETLSEKPSFKNIQDNRCIIIVDGFYEWQQYYGQKVKYEIGHNNELFALAGLYDEHEGIKSYTIITTEAQGIMKEIHNTKLRMPYAFIELDKMHSWLQGNDVPTFYDFSAIQLDDKQGVLF